MQILRKSAAVASKFARLSEIARRNGWLDDDGLKRAASQLENRWRPLLTELPAARPRQY